MHGCDNYIGDHLRSTELSRHVGSSRQLVTSARHVGLSRYRGGSRKLWVGGSSFCVIKGEALDRGTKSRAGGGYGRGGVPPPYVEEN